MRRYLANAHAGYPYKLFSALSGDEYARRIVKDPACFHDELAGWHMQHYGNSLRSPESLAILSALAMTVRTDIARQEARHSLARRYVVMGSQTWCKTLESVSGDWALARQRGIEVGPHAHPSTAKKTDRPARAPKERKLGKRLLEHYSRRGIVQVKGGGPYRVFCSQQLAGQGFASGDRLRALGLQYRRIKAEGGDEWQQLVREGRIACRVHQRGGVAFANRVLARLRRRRRAWPRRRRR